MPRKITFLSLCVILLTVAIFRSQKDKEGQTQPLTPRTWAIQSIDTMKYSRDVAREKLSDPGYDQTIDKQVSLIAKTGATHIAIGTPYDDEFLPFIKRWINTARKYRLKVWFRGNFSGWENWFDYKDISREEHTQQISKFITNNPSLFEDGDLFSSCPECENGGPGDPRHTGNLTEYRNFLVKESQVVSDSFKKINKAIPSNLYSMNGDVAKLVMDKDTTRKLGGFVVIDHYVNSPDKLITDIRSLINQSGGRIILGEFGAPIPDIHGKMTEEDQAIWIGESLQKLYQEKNVVGINYWTSFGSSTALWNHDGSPRKAVKTISLYYSPQYISGNLKTYFDLPVKNATVSNSNNTTLTDNKGNYQIPTISGSDTLLTVSHTRFNPINFNPKTNTNPHLSPKSLWSFLLYVLE